MKTLQATRWILWRSVTVGFWVWLLAALIALQSPLWRTQHHEIFEAIQNDARQLAFAAYQHFEKDPESSAVLVEIDPISGKVSGPLSHYGLTAVTRGIQLVGSHLYKDREFVLYWSRQTSDNAVIGLTMPFRSEGRYTGRRFVSPEPHAVTLFEFLSSLFAQLLKSGHIWIISLVFPGLALCKYSWDYSRMAKGLDLELQPLLESNLQNLSKPQVEALRNGQAIIRPLLGPVADDGFTQWEVKLSGGEAGAGRGDGGGGRGALAAGSAAPAWVVARRPRLSRALYADGPRN